MDSTYFQQSTSSTPEISRHGSITCRRKVQDSIRYDSWYHKTKVNNRVMMRKLCSKNFQEVQYMQQLITDEVFQRFSYKVTVFYSF